MTHVIHFFDHSFSLNISKVAFYLINFPVHWYSLMYVFAFILSNMVMIKFSKDKSLSLNVSETINLVLLLSLFGIFFGKLAHVLFYWSEIKHLLPSALLSNSIGITFHGVLFGDIAIIFFYSIYKNKRFYNLTDHISFMSAIFLLFTRIGNFINCELFGTSSGLNFGVVFSNAGTELRHPTQMYEFILEGVFMLIILFFIKKKKIEGLTSAFFMMTYGFSRFITEYVREIDPHLNYYINNQFTVSQIISIITFLSGIWVLISIKYNINIKTIKSFLSKSSYSKDI